MTFKLKATVIVDTGDSRTESRVDTPESLASESVHVLVQHLGTQGAKAFINKKLDEYLPEYPGYKKGS